MEHINTSTLKQRAVIFSLLLFSFLLVFLLSGGITASAEPCTLYTNVFTPNDTWVAVHYNSDSNAENNLGVIPTSSLAAYSASVSKTADIRIAASGDDVVVQNPALRFIDNFEDNSIT